MQPPTASFLPTTLLHWPRKSLVELHENAWDTIQLVLAACNAGTSAVPTPVMQRAGASISADLAQL